MNEEVVDGICEGSDEGVTLIPINNKFGPQCNAGYTVRFEFESQAFVAVWAFDAALGWHLVLADAERRVVEEIDEEEAEEFTTQYSGTMTFVLKRDRRNHKGYVVRRMRYNYKQQLEAEFLNEETQEFIQFTQVRIYSGYAVPTSKPPPVPVSVAPHPTQSARVLSRSTNKSVANLEEARKRFKRISEHSKYIREHKQQIV